MAELKTQAETTRQHLDAADMAQRDALARLLEQRDAAARRFATETTPHYNATVDLYNAAASAFNRTCGDKAYDWSVLSQVQKRIVMSFPRRLDQIIWQTPRRVTANAVCCIRRLSALGPNYPRRRSRLGFC